MKNSQVMETGETLLTAAEFASNVNLSDRQIRRLMRSGRLHFIIGDDRIARITESELSRFQEDRGGRTDVSGKTDGPLCVSGRTTLRPDGQTTSDTDSDAFTRQLLPLHERALKLLDEERQERRTAQESARRLESQLLGLQHTLQSYQRALSENAESLAERESLRLVAEKHAQEVAQEREEIQAEREAMLESVKFAQDRVSWLEKRFNRLPRWVRRWLEAG